MDDKDAGTSHGKRQVESIPDGSSREAEAEASVVTSNSAMGDKEKKLAKRARIVWTAELHEKFVDAVNQLGVANARPSSIMTLMNVDGLTRPIVASHLQGFWRSLREQRRSEGAAVGAQQVSEGGNSGVDQAFDADNVQMHMKGVNVPDAHKVFDKMSQRTTGDSSCATQITVSSSASQHEVSSASTLASNFRRFNESSRSDFTPLALDSIVQKGAKCLGEDSKRALVIFQGKSTTNKLNRFEFYSLAKLVLNIMRWRKRASAPPNRRENQIQGPRPSPLRISKDSHKISKTSPIPPPKPVTQQPPSPAIIVFADPSNFRSIVQQFTGNQSTSSESAAFSGDLPVSPAARYASIEKTSRSERDRREKRDDEVPELMMMINNDNRSSNNNYNINNTNTNNNNNNNNNSNNYGMQGVSMGQCPGILSPAPAPANLPALSAAMFSRKFNQQITSSSAATHKEASFHLVPKTWRSKRRAFELGGLPEEKDAGFNSLGIYQGKSITNKLILFEFDSLVKLVLNIMRWKKRASARLNLAFNVGKKVDESGSFAQFNNNLINVSPVNWWSSRNLSLERSVLPEKKDADFNSLAIFQGKSITRTPTFQLLELAGEMRSKLESMVKLVLSVVRWKRRALSRHRNRKLIKMEDRTMEVPDLLQEENLVAESPCTQFHSDSHVRDMDWDFHSSQSLDQIPFEFDAMIVDDALFYCALFPPDHEFEKETLVQVWMALGIFVDEPLEMFASLLFEDCLTKGYFQFLRTNLVTGKAMYKFIQKTQPLPLSIGSHINLSLVSLEVTHASIRCCDLKDCTALLGFQRFKQLRALIFLHGHELSFKQVPRNFFLSLRELQVLDLSKTRLIELPTSIGIMKCLCFLDLSDTLIKRLPEAVGCLEKLQTLKLKGCLNISTLPKGMRKLINLRHLDFDVFRQLRSMPEGMGDLANIQTLSAFLVGVEDGCSIRQIKNMNNLSGSFCISRLENVLTKDEAEEACLSNKTQLKKIELHWSDSQDEDVVGYEKVLSSLQPNTSLEELNISCYGGLELPSWICDPKFSQLVCITLFECEKCLVLPSLGQLPSLKYLNIVNFHKLKVIDHKFYGDLGIQGYVSFPKLEKLTVENMSSLEEWLGIRSFDFPCLLNLTVRHCPKLHSLCTLSSLCSLKNLEISHCAVLASCPDGKLPARVETFIIESCPLISAGFLNGGQDSQSVAHIPHIWIDHREISLG